EEEEEEESSLLVRQSNKFKCAISNLTVVIPCALHSIDGLREKFCMKLRKGNREIPAKLLKIQEPAAKRVRAITQSLSLQEDKLCGRLGCEHLNDPLHILVEAEFTVNIIDTRLGQEQEIIIELLKPVEEYSLSF
ncbi:hypothetical protein C5167_043913, partial [Papaver somniferum]